MKRNVAKKVLVNDILTSTYIKRPGWDPSGILTKYGEISRINIVGIVVSLSKEDNPSFLLDDGSGSVMVRFFEKNNKMENLKLGDLINVVGKPREWNSSKYIVPEIIRKIDNKKWYKIHQMEVKSQNKDVLPVSPSNVKEEPQEIGPYQKVINIISVLDKGKGADVQEIVNNINDADKIISELLQEGEIFELSPGKVKLLE
jgi:RPA family protein